MTQERYLKMQEQMGREPDLEQMPAGFDDLPYIVQVAMNTFNMLGDRVQSDIGYVGKDYTNLPLYKHLYAIDDHEFFLELLSWLDARAIKKSSEQMKKELAKLKRKK
jgi:hypothetical protein